MAGPTLHLSGLLESGRGLQRRPGCHLAAETSWTAQGYELREVSDEESGPRRVTQGKLRSES